MNKFLIKNEINNDQTKFTKEKPAMNPKFEQNTNFFYFKKY